MNRDRNDLREPPHCRRCGVLAEPGDWYCWLCGSEELMLGNKPVPHVYLMACTNSVQAERNTQCV